MKNLTIFLIIFFTLEIPLTFALLKRDIANLHVLEELPISPAFGPESTVFDDNGKGPYTGVSNGRILKWRGSRFGWHQFATTSPIRTSDCDSNTYFDQVNLESKCGRPLGLQFNEGTGDLYIADAYFGLLTVGREGGVAAQLAVAADGVPFRFTNGLDVDQQNGMVYFTDSSTRYTRREIPLIVITGDATGRLMKYNPESKLLTVLKKELVYPNGVALNKDNTFLIVGETTTCRLLRYWLQGPKTGTLELFAQLPGYPDNVKKNAKGEFWVALTPNTMNGHPVGIRLSENGEVLEVLDGRVWTSISEVHEVNGTLWIGSVNMPYVTVYEN